MRRYVSAACSHLWSADDPQGGWRGDAAGGLGHEFVEEDARDLSAAVPLGEKHAVALSPEICAALTGLRQTLRFVCQRVHSGSYRTLCRTVAGRLDCFLFERVIQASTFTRRGAAQLELDMTVLFALLPSAPDATTVSTEEAGMFPLLREACLILNFGAAKRHTLKRSLEEMRGADSAERKAAACFLSGHGVTHTEPAVALDLLSSVL